MMEPVTALGLAAAVVQFSVYGYKILAKGNDLRHSADGILEENKFLETVITDLEGFLDRIQSTPASSVLGFKQFRDTSLKLVNELLQALDNLKVKGSKTRWKSLRKALKSVHGKEKIQAWLDQLDLLRQEFNTHIEVAILEKIDLLTITSTNEFQTLRKEQQSSLQLFIDAVRGAVDPFAHDLQTQTLEINKFNESEHQVTRENDDRNHVETRNVIHETNELIIQQVDRTQQSNRDEHDQIKQHITSAQASAVVAISSELTESAQRSQNQQILAQNELGQSISTQVNEAKDHVVNQLLADTESLKVDLFRSELQNEFQALTITSNIRQAVQDINTSDRRAFDNINSIQTYQSHVYPAERFRGSKRQTTHDKNTNDTRVSPASNGKQHTEISHYDTQPVNFLDQFYSKSVDPSFSSQQISGSDLLDEFKLIHEEFEVAECICNLPQSEQDAITKVSSVRVRARQKYFGLKHRLTTDALLDLARRMLCQNNISHAFFLCDEIEKARSCDGDGDNDKAVTTRQLLRARYIKALTNVGIGKIDAAASSVQDLLVLSCDLLGADHPWTLDIHFLQVEICYNQEDYAGATSICEQALQKMSAVRGPVHPKTLQIYLVLGDLLLVQNRPREACLHYEHVHTARRQDLGEVHVDTLLAQEALGIADLELNNLDAAELRLRQALQGLEKKLGPTHPIALRSLHWLSKIQSALGRTGQARSSQLQLFRHKDILSPASYFHMYHGILEENGRLLADEGKLDEAVELLEEVRRPFTYAGDRRRLSTITNLRSQLAILYGRQKRSYEAIVLLRQCLREFTEHSGHHNLVNALTSWRLGEVYSGLNDTDVAWTEYNTCIDIMIHCLGNHDRLVITYLEKLAGECSMKEMWPQEMEVRHKLELLLKEQFGTWNDRYLENAKKYATVLYRCKSFKAAEKQLQSTYSYTINKHGQRSRAALLVKAELAKLWEAQERWADAELGWDSLLKMLKQRIKDARLDDEIDILNLLGCNLIAQRRLNEAITILDRALSLFESNSDCNRSNYSAVFQNLVKAYKAKGLPDSAPELVVLERRRLKFHSSGLPESKGKEDTFGPISRWLKSSDDPYHGLSKSVDKDSSTV